MTTTNPRVFVLPEAIKAHRAKQSLSQAELAERSGVSLGLIGLIETGQRQPGWHNAAAIAEALEIGVEAFAVVLDDDNATYARLRKISAHLEVAA